MGPKGDRNMTMPTTESRILSTVCEYNMLQGGMTVIAGVSGGADSTAMLHWLVQHAKTFDIHVIAAHVNHGIRGAEADRDEAFVQKLCGSMDVPLRILHANVRAEAKKAGEGLEECGRRVRYAFFYQLCEHYQNVCIATAHTLSDCAETVLLHLTCGAGASGLAGIPPVRGNIVRPLIAVTRTQTEQYCKDYGLPYVTDSTNADASFSRNRIRLRVIPELKEIDPNFEQAAGRAARSLREDEDCLKQLAKQALQTAVCRGGWKAPLLCSQPRAVRMRALYFAAKSAGAGRLEQKHLDALDRLLFSGGGCTLPGGCTARVEQGILLFPQKTADYCVPLCLPQTVLPDGRVLEMKILDRTTFEKEKPKIIFSNCLNYDTITSDAVVRTRRSGDTFSPAGRGVTKTLKKLLNEHCIPPSMRAGLAILSCSTGISWIEGCGPSEKAKVTQTTQHIAVVKIKECVGNGKSDAR